MTYATPPYRLHRPATIAEAVALAGELPGARFLAGGTDLVVNLRRRIVEPEHVIALEGIAELRDLGRDGSDLLIGAAVTLERLAADPTVAAEMPLLAEAAGVVAGPTIRAMGTLGGNLVLDTRCKYYNQSFFWRQANDFCLKKDGTVCHVAPGGTFCWAAFSADTPPTLLVLGASLELIGPGGARAVPLAEFYGDDGRWSIGESPGGLRAGELIARVRVPLPGAEWRGVYEKLRVRGSIDYPLAGVAMMLRGGSPSDGPVEEVRMALTALNPRPLLVPGLEPLAGRPFSPESVTELSRAAHRTGKPMRTAVADPAYRRAMITALVEKAAARIEPALADALMERARWA